MGVERVFLILSFGIYCSFLMMRQVFSNVFALFVICELDEAGINYNIGAGGFFQRGFISADCAI